MSNGKIKFVFAFNAKLNGYLSYNYIALAFYSNKCRGRRIQFYTYKNMSHELYQKTLFSLSIGRFEATGDALYSRAVSIPI